MLIEFEPLLEDEPIGVAALSGPVDAEAFNAGLEVLRAWGRPVELAANVYDRDGYLAGSDSSRLAGLVELLDKGVRCIIAARGGYGATRLLPKLPWQRLVDRRTFFVGYSDLTAVMNPLVRRGGAVQVHGPMVTELKPGCEATERLHLLLEGRSDQSELMAFSPAAVLRSGRANGVAIGGNLSVLAALAGTPYEVDLEGAVVFVEDVNESAYRLDRLLTQLRLSGTFRGVKAFISGNLHCCSADQPETWRKLLLEVAPAGVPVVDGLSFGHGCTSLPFPIGAEVTVDTTAGTVSWRS